MSFLGSSLSSSSVPNNSRGRETRVDYQLSRPRRKTVIVFLRLRNCGQWGWWLLRNCEAGKYVKDSCVFLTLEQNRNGGGEQKIICTNVNSLKSRG